jgi:hypothetical protein
MHVPNSNSRPHRSQTFGGTNGGGGGRVGPEFMSRREPPTAASLVPNTASTMAPAGHDDKVPCGHRYRHRRRGNIAVADHRGESGRLSPQRPPGRPWSRSRSSTRARGRSASRRRRDPRRLQVWTVHTWRPAVLDAAPDPGSRPAIFVVATTSSSSRAREAAARVRHAQGWPGQQRSIGDGVRRSPAFALVAGARRHGFNVALVLRPGKAAARNRRLLRAIAAQQGGRDVPPSRPSRRGLQGLGARPKPAYGRASVADV